MAGRRGTQEHARREIIDRLNGEISAGLTDPKMKTRIAELGGTVLAGSLAAFGKIIADETEKWAKVVKFAGTSRSDLAAGRHSINSVARNRGRPAAPTR